MIEEENEGSPGFRLDARRWTWRERIAGAASLVLLVALFLPWFSLTVGRTPVGESSGFQDGTLGLVSILILGIVALLVLRAGFGRIPFAPPPADRLLLAAAAWLNFLIVLVAFLLKPSYGSQFPAVHLSAGWQAGAFLGLAAATVAAVASGLPGLPVRQRGL